jgi:DNA polymerase/3'-5' exonuclease PolX
MKYADALRLATRIQDLLAPHCERIEIAGSVRRQRADVKDIEIVAIPKPFETLLFQSGIATVVNDWEKVRGDITPEARYTQRIIRWTVGTDQCFPQLLGLNLAMGPATFGQKLSGWNETKLDLFLCTPTNWGLMMVYRTGSKEFNIRWLRQAKKRGYDMTGGQIYAAGRKEPVQIREEQDLFSRIGMPLVPPQQRNS